MNDQSTTTEEPRLNNYFSSNTTEFVKTAHLRITPLNSRLLSIRQMLAKCCESQVTHFELSQAQGSCEERYELQMHHYEVEISVNSRNHYAVKARTVRESATAKNFNSLLKSLHADSQHDRTSASKDEHNVINDLLMRIFVIGSQTTIYEVEQDAGHWSIYFTDPRNMVHAEIIVRRKHCN